MSRAITVTPPTGTSAAPRPMPAAGSVAARSVLHVTRSPRGGAATAVRSEVERAREVGVDVQWATVSSEGWFAPIVERLTSALQGSCAGETELGEPERLTYASVLNTGAGMLAEMLPHPGIVFLHDPATAGLCRSMKRAGATVAWVCHLPLGEPNGTARGAWSSFSRTSRPPTGSRSFGRLASRPSSTAGASSCRRRARSLRWPRRTERRRGST